VPGVDGADRFGCVALRWLFLFRVHSFETPVFGALSEIVGRGSLRQ